MLFFYIADAIFKLMVMWTLSAGGQGNATSDCEQPNCFEFDVEKLADAIRHGHYERVFSFA